MPGLCELGAVCAMALTGRAEVMVNLSLTLQSAIALNMTKEGSEVVIAGITTGVPDASVQIARVPISGGNIQIALTDTLEVEQPFAIAGVSYANCHLF